MDNKKITVSKILDICDGKLISGDTNLKVFSFSNDTRTIQSGDLYFAIKGEKTNGNIYIEDALKKGAIGCITDDEINKEILENFKSKVFIKVDNTVKALQKIATYKRSMYNIPVIAVTGSVRKN